jgi:hypothetical protein
MKIDPKQQGHLPRVDEPSPFVSPDGRFRGWRVSIPGRRDGRTLCKGSAGLFNEELKPSRHGISAKGFFVPSADSSKQEIFHSFSIGLR